MQNRGILKFGTHWTSPKALTVYGAPRTLNLHIGRKRLRKLKLRLSDCLPALDLLGPFADHP